MSALSPEIQKAIDAAVARAVAHLAPREQYLTAYECADVMKLHRDTVLRLVHGGKLRSVGRGRQLRIPHSAVVEYFAPSKTKEDTR
jgi:excisionase family DNA binding protein